MKWIHILPMSLIICFGCSKAEGPGGNSSIQGKILARKFDPKLKTYSAVYPDADDNVYIIYGTQPGVGNNAKTDFNGVYYFPYLYSGNYTIYVYSKDTTLQNPSGQLVAKQTISLGSKKNVTVPDILIGQ